MARVVFCGRCGHTRLQHQTIEDDEPGCWNPACLMAKDRCREFVERAAKPRVDRKVAPVGRRSPDTAHVAAQVARLRSGTRRKEVFDLIRNAGHRGLTDDELEAATGRSHQSLSATRNTLMNDDLIVDSGMRRPTRYKNPAIVWVVPGLPAETETANS